MSKGRWLLALTLSNSPLAAQPAPTLGPTPAQAPAAPAPPPAFTIVQPAAPQTDRAAAEIDPGAGLPAAENAAREPWLGVLGARELYVVSEGYDPFDDDDAMTQFSVGFGRSVYSEGRFAVAAFLFYDVGSTSSSAREQATELVVHRGSLGLEARFHPLPELYGYGRIAPGVLNVTAELDEAASGLTLSDESWGFGVDATAGLAYRFARTQGATNVGFWLLAEGGYGITTSGDLVLERDEDSPSSPERVAPLSLGEGSVALSGATFRLLGGVSF